MTVLCCQTQGLALVRTCRLATCVEGKPALDQTSPLQCFGDGNSLICLPRSTVALTLMVKGLQVTATPFLEEVVIVSWIKCHKK